MQIHTKLHYNITKHKEVVSIFYKQSLQFSGTALVANEINALDSDVCMAFTLMHI